jgi:hypothetical protein
MVEPWRAQVVDDPEGARVGGERGACRHNDDQDGEHRKSDDADHGEQPRNSSAAHLRTSRILRW